MKRSQNFLAECEEQFEIFFQNFKDYKDNVEKFTFTKDQLDCEINFAKALISLKEKNDSKGLEKLTNVLRIGERYSFELRRKVLAKLYQVFFENSLEPTENFLRLYYKSLPEENPDKEARRNFLFVLDYSKSMALGNKIEMALKIFLKVWDFYVLDEDHVAFIRFNLNTEIVFGLSPKKRSKFQKRNHIERSCDPSERTSVYDALFNSLKELGPYPDSQPDSFMILFSDGPDTSSQITLKRLRVKLGLYPNLKFIVIGLGLQKYPEHVENMTKLAKMTGGYFVDIQDKKIDMIFDLICGYIQGVRLNMYNLTTETVRT